MPDHVGIQPPDARFEAALLAVDRNHNIQDGLATPATRGSDRSSVSTCIETASTTMMCLPCGIPVPHL